MSQTDSATRYQTAARLFSQNDYPGALAILDELIAANPHAAPLHFHRSRCLLALNHKVDATSALDTVLRLVPDNVPALLMRVELGQVAGEEFDPLPLLHRAMQKEPDNARVLAMLADTESAALAAFLSSGVEPEAESIAEPVTELVAEPEPGVALELQAEHESEIEPEFQPETEPESGADSPDDMSATPPSAEDDASSLAQRAEEHYRRALTEADGEDVVRDLLGMRYNRSALESALHDFQRAATLSRNNHHEQRAAQIAEILGRYDVATDHLDRVLERLPEDSPARGFLQEERDRASQGDVGAREHLATMIEDAGASEQVERNLEEDMAYAVTHTAAELIRQGQDMQTALDAVAGDDSPEAMMATNIAFQLYNYAHEPAPDLVEVSASDYPAYQRRHADACEKALASLGYTRLADAEALGITTSQGIRTLIRVFAHPEYGSAAAFAIKPKWPGLIAFLLMFLTGKWKTARMLECATYFDDDCFMNSRAAGPDPFDNSGIPNYAFEKLPPDATPAQVAERHMERVTGRLADTNARVLPPSSLGDVGQVWEATNALKADYRRQIGYATDDELRALLGGQYDRLAELVRERLKLLAGG
ncbi:tetratricopeptide repeat protein [Xanthomonadaceae bacterium JHOS43]|nr:tetratricopeptide repeat protein [Xanthomonadaceae bacterium JHOS43]